MGRVLLVAWRTACVCVTPLGEALHLDSSGFYHELSPWLSVLSLLCVTKVNTSPC